MDKLLSGFSVLPKQEGKQIHVACPHWGCDLAFNGYPEVKALVVWMAATRADCDVTLCVGSSGVDRSLAQQLKPLIEGAEEHDISVKDVYLACLEVATLEPVKENFIELVVNELGLKQPGGDTREAQEIRETDELEDSFTHQDDLLPE
mmetsp:Transcript_42389/g.66368  ORF Transcript_42389/g.66368 Transcript_42389/m.66368 type:complete len:148 (+) Transcript_42389:721-1164(+)